ncbi:MAG: glycosyltransferase family 4 protein, partial [Endozoicomonas sp.]
MKRLLAAASASIADHIAVTIPYKGEVEMLPLAVEPDDAYQGTQSEAREQLGYRVDRTVILTLGRISPGDKMDLHPLLLVLNDLVEQHGHSDVLLVIAGAGDASHESVQSLLKQAYALNLESSIRFELSIDDERKRWLYAACDIFISLAENIQESFGLAPLEAMLHGAPVVLSDWNGYSELVQDGHSGFLIHTLSADHDGLSRPAGALVSRQAHLIQAQGTAVNLSQCAEVVHQLLTDDTLLRQVAEQGRERVQQNFCWEQVVESYHELVSRLNKEAEQLSCASGRPVGLPYQQVFAHYPSEQVSDEMTFMTTDRGIRRLLNSEPGFFYSELEGLLQSEQINQLADACLSGCSLRELQSQYSHGGSESNRLVFTLLWMCKYQLLEAGKSQRPPLIAQRGRALPDQGKLPRELFSHIHCPEPHRFKLVEPLLAWIDHLCTSTHGQPENVWLRADLLNHLVSHLDEQLLQAIGWTSNELGVSSYADVLDHIVSKGGGEYLVAAYPQWYRVNRRIIVRTLRDSQRLFRRFYHDREAINGLFESVWSQPANDIVRVAFPYG